MGWLNLVTLVASLGDTCGQVVFSSASGLARILCAAASRALMVEVASLAVGGLGSVIISDSTWRDAM